MFLQMVLRFRSRVFLRGPPVHGVVAHSVWSEGHPVRADSERLCRSFASSHTPAWCSLAGGAQYLVPALATRFFPDQTHSRAHRSAHLSTKYSFPPQPVFGAVSPPQAVVARPRYPPVHDR